MTTITAGSARGSIWRLRRIRTAALAFALCAAPSLLGAQTGPKVQWDQAESVATAAGFAYALKVDASAPTPLVTTCAPLASTPGLLSHCSAPLPTLTPGTHTLTVTATNAFGTASSSPLTGAPPTAPVNIVITITVQVGGA